MSTIQNEINRIKESVADAYETVELMGGDVPSPDLQKIDTLSDSIATIKGGSGSVGSENILLNWDFRNPVNRSGSTTYSLTTTRCTVDSWYSENGCTVNVVDGGVTFDPKNDATCVFGQNVKEWELMKGKTVTFSALVSNVSASGLNLWIYGVEGPVALPAIEVGNDVTLYSITGTVDNGASSLRCGIQAVSSTATIKMIAAKLEYGSKQTLAKQNSDNVWEILDPPNYDLQYILCSQYDPITDVRIGSKHSNVNFIQNWYFPQPVNRNGKTSGFAPDETVIDRWSNFSSTKSPSVTSSGIEIIGWRNGSSNIRSSIYQVLSGGVFEFLVNKQATLSFLTTSGELGIVTEVVSPTGTMEAIYARTSKLQGFMYRWSGHQNGRFCVVIDGNTSTLTSEDYTEDNPLTDTIVAVKLELGPIQTLARKEGDIWVLNDVPDYDTQYLLCSQYDPDRPIPTRNVYYYSNPNLLLNWDFRNPVNRNGKTEYPSVMSSVYTIDRWRSCRAITTFVNEGMQLIDGGAGKGSYVIDQIIEKDRLSSNIVTFSAIINGELFSHVFTAPGNSPTINKIRFSMNDNDGNFLFAIYYFGTESITIQAVKLELGSTQTLAKKNASGEWEIIDPPNYDLQYLLTSQYSPINGAYVGIQHSNPNLLDNWYFADPINQRGANSVTLTSSSYAFIDRWYAVSFNEVEYSFISGQGIKVKNINTGDGSGGLAQRLDNLSLFNKTMTASILSSDGNLYIVTGKVTTSGNWDMNRNYNIVWIGVRYIASINAIEIRITTPEITILAAKLELGPVQTLAHKEGDTWVLNDPPPNKQQELAKCQRYYWKSAPVNATFSTYGLTIWKKNDTTLWLRPAVNQPVTMRVRPSIKINGVSPGGEVTLRNNTPNTTIKGILDVPSDFALSKDKLFYIVLKNYVGDFTLEDIFEGTIELDANI